MPVLWNQSEAILLLYLTLPKNN